MNKRRWVLMLTLAGLLLISCTSADKNKSKYPSAEEKEVSKKTVKIAVPKKTSAKKPSTKFSISQRAGEIGNYAEQNGYSTRYCFLIDLSMPSGRNRFFVYDLEKRSVAYAGLVAHGSCNERFLSQARFSNTNNSGCSSPGKYKVGSFYHGQYGESFKLHGLDKSNSNAYRRGVVIHGYDCVPDEEIFPRVLCNSLGCPMVSYTFFDKLSRIIQQSKKPIVLWVYR